MGKESTLARQEEMDCAVEGGLHVTCMLCVEEVAAVPFGRPSAAMTTVISPLLSCIAGHVKSSHAWLCGCWQVAAQMLARLQSTVRGTVVVLLHVLLWGNSTLACHFWLPRCGGTPDCIG